MFLVSSNIDMAVMPQLSGPCVE